MRGRLSCHRLSSAVNVVNGLSSWLVTNQIALIQSQELYLVPWCSFTPLCKLQVEAVTYDETYTVDCPDSLQGIPLITIFFSNPVVRTWYQELFDSPKFFKTSLNTYKYGCARTLWEWNFLLCGIILKLEVLRILRVVVSLEMFCFHSLVELSEI